ncbi:ANO5 [Symbiodinium sp. CCMP2592]|nr:ANO5 [Symbiodinium sp. CCMP2592]
MGANASRAVSSCHCHREEEHLLKETAGDASVSSDVEQPHPSSSVIRVMGCQLLPKFGRAQYVMVFPNRRPDLDENSAEQFRKPVKSAVAMWKDIFQQSEPPGTIKDGMAFEDFVREVVEKVELVLTSIGCDVEQDCSVDNDEVFLAIQVTNHETLDSMAERMEARAQVKAKAYEQKTFKCPTDVKLRERDGNQATFKRTDTGDRYLNGAVIDNSCPAYVRFSKDIKDKLEDFNEPEQLRIVRRTILRKIDLAALEETKVLTQFFAAHDWDSLQELYNRGWSDPTRLFIWPSHTVPDYLANYFGVQVAYYYHFCNMYTRFLLVPAICSILVLSLRFSGWLGHHQRQLVNMIYGIGLCVWTTYFLASYNQSLHLKSLRWGMDGTNSASAAVRRQFRDEDRDTVWERLRNMFHWMLCFLFVCETVGVIAFVSSRRLAAFNNPDGVTFGLPNNVAVHAVKYIIIANIKAVNALWTRLSPYLSNHENWRTDVELKSNMVLKLFAVKFVVFYYPFFYTVFLQPYIEGCEGDVMEGCLAQLRSDLASFFVFQLVLEAGEVIFMLAMVYWRISTELSNKKKIAGEEYHEDRPYLTFLEYQALCKPYTMTDEVADYMNGVLNFGFVALFGVTTPSICILCFLGAFPAKRLTAYKLCFAKQRVIPRVQHGVGSWSSILHFLAYVGATSTCYIVMFLFDSWDLSPCQSVLAFVFAERVVWALQFVVHSFLGAKSVAQKRIEEHNDNVLEAVLERHTHETIAQGSTRQSARSSRFFQQIKEEKKSA